MKNAHLNTDTPSKTDTETERGRWETMEIDELLDEIEADDCTHANLAQGKVDVRRDLGHVYIDYRCDDCGDKLTEDFSRSGWLDKTGFETDAPEGSR